MIIDFNTSKRGKKSGTPFYKNKIAIATFLLLTLISFLFIDKPLALIFYKMGSDLQDPFLFIPRIFSPLFTVLVFPSIFFIIRFVLKNERKSRKLQLLSLAPPLALLLCYFLAILVGRSSPSWLFDHGEMTVRLLQWSPSFRSFPSVLSCNIGAIGSCLVFLYPKRSLQLLIATIGLSLMPVLLTECFLSDALVGLVIGFAVSLFAFLTMKKDTAF